MEGIDDIPIKEKSSNLEEFIVNDGVFEDPLRMNLLVRFLSRNHQKLMEDEMYQLYHGRIIFDYKEEGELRLAKEKILK